MKEATKPHPSPAAKRRRSRTEVAHEGSRTTARQRRTKAHDIEKRKKPRLTRKENVPTRGRSVRKGARASVSGLSR